jgi:hypothetical protein
MSRIVIVMLIYFFFVTGVCILLRELSDHKTNLRSQQVSCITTTALQVKEPTKELL